MPNDSLGQESEVVNIGQWEHVDVPILLTLLPVVVAFAFVVFVLYRSRREAYFKEKETSFRLTIAEMEMKVLRSQVNPHFIFNCLNSIQHFIHGNNSTAASEYLVKFSRLIRHVLEASHERLIPLSEEILALTLYLELEQLRTRGAFNFEFLIDEKIKSDEFYVPPLFVQPLVENAIWHGLANRSEGGVIRLTLELAEGMLKWTIDDNGGIAERKLKPYDLSAFVKRNSRGLELIEDRIAVINRIYAIDRHGPAQLTRDKLPEGTRVTITLPYEN
ncbi:MAG: histidine kinase [Cyclobacteriaceae bacterium]|nr:histidine kinase [Cyclobacteriaceae bacterium]